MKRALVIGVSAVVGCAGAALAHDFWIEPSTFAPRVPASVSLRLRVGENFSGNPVRRNSAAISRFVSSGPQGEIDVPGLEGRDPAGFLRVDERGDYVVGYETRGQSIELAGDRFESYLGEEGLEHVIEARRRAGEGDTPGREIFVRCAKTLVRTAGAPEAGVAGGERSLGLSLELLLEEEPGSNPARTAVRLVYRGEGVAGVRIGALRRAAADEPIFARTDADGRVDLPLSAGDWLIKGVHMVPIEGEADADWKSYWASLTLKIPESPGP